MEIIKAKFYQQWRGHEVGKDEPYPNITSRQAERLIDCGRAYREVEVPTMDNTKKEIEAYLQAENIEFSEYATKAELLELI